MAEEKHKDLDGLAKNLDKMKKGWKKIRPELQPHIDRFKGGSWFSRGKDNKFHTGLNIFTEATRLDPYLMTHIYVWTIGVMLLISLGLLGILAFLT